MSQKMRRPVVFFLLVILLTAVILYFGRRFLIPLTFGGLLAMLFYPLYKNLVRRGIPRSGAIGVSLLILIIAGGGLSTAVFFQTRSLVGDWPQIRQELQKKQDQVEELIIENVGIASQERIDRIKKRFSQQSSSLFSYLQRFLGSFFSFVTNMVLVILFMVMLLWEEQRLGRFILKLAPADRREKARNTMQDTRRVAAQYLLGRLLLIGILGVLYSAGFLIFGLKYAVSLAVLVAVLSIIPYLGNIIGGVFALAVALATGGQLTTLLGVLGTMVLAQFLENYVLTPWIMGSRVDLNPLATLACVIAFGLLWGVAGTILAIPMVSAMKKIFDHMDHTNPYGYLLGLETAQQEQ